jgi:hypothetical protein
MLRGLSNELRWERSAPAEDVAPRLVDDIQLLAVEGFHRLNGAGRKRSQMYDHAYLRMSSVIFMLQQ